MCIRCLAAQRSLNECSESSDSDVSAALGGAYGSGGTTVTDHRSILYYLEGGDNFRWNAEQSLGSSIVVTYSFASGADLPSTYSNFDNPYDASSFSSFTGAQRQNFRLAAQEFMAVSGLVLVEVESGGDIEVLNAHGTYVGGYADLPYVNRANPSEVELVVDSTGSYSKGSYGYFTILHELGHAVGLDHTHEGAYTLAQNMDTTAQTVMSYNYDASALGLQALDVAALQAIYGNPVLSGGWNLTHNTNTNRLDANGSAANDTFSVPLTAQNSAMATKIFGALGDDVIEGQDASDILRGNQGNDALEGMGGDDKLRGGAGDDAIYGGDGNDFIHGGSGADTIYGGSGNDQAIGGAAEDLIYGQAGNDVLTGLLNNDTLSGGAGKDTLDGGRGNDVLTGGDGADVFVFHSDAAKDIVTDFNVGMDLLRFVGTGAAYTDLQISEDGGDTLIELGEVSIRLADVDTASLGADQFEFV